MIARILLLFTPGLIRESVNVIDDFRKGDIIDIGLVQNELIPRQRGLNLKLVHWF